MLHSFKERSKSHAVAMISSR